MAKIKIGADVREVRRSIMELSRDLDSKLSKKLGLFDEDTKRILSDETSRQIKDAHTNIKKLKEEAKGYADQIAKAAKDSKEEAKARKGMINTIRTLKRESQDLMKLEGSRQGGGGFARFGSMIQRGMGGRMGGLGGLMRGGLMGLGIGGILGAGAYAFGRGAQAFGTFRQGGESRQMLRGRGINNVFDTNETLSNLGFSPERVRRGRIQAADMFGKGRAGVADFADTARFSKAFGLQTEDVQGMMTGMRGTLGREGAGGQFDLLKKHASLIGEAMDDAVGIYLETSANMLTQMNQNGLVLSDEVMNVFTSLTREGSQPIERIAKQMMTAQAAVQGSSGEANAFLQRAFASQGIGGGRVGLAQIAIQTSGLFGMGQDQAEAAGLRPGQMESFRRMGIMGTGTGFKARATGVVNTMNRMFSGSDEGLAAKGRFAQGIFGTQNAPEAIGILNRLEDALAKGDDKALEDIKDQLKDMAKGPQEKMAEHLRNIQESTTGQLDKLDALRKLQEEKLGRTIAPAVLKIQRSILNIDKNLTDVISKFFGIASPQERMEEALKGGKALESKDVKDFMNLEPGKLKNLLPTLVEKMSELKLEMPKIDRGGGRTGIENEARFRQMETSLSNLSITLSEIHTAIIRQHKEKKQKAKILSQSPGKTRN